MESSRKDQARSSLLRRTVLAAAWCVLSYSALGHRLASAQVEYLGSTQLSGKTTDKSGLSGLLETNTPIDAFGGLSAIDYTGSGNRYVVLSDRGAGDGAASFPCRFHTVVLNVDPKTRTIQFQLEATTMLRDAGGQVDDRKSIGAQEPGTNPSVAQVTIQKAYAIWGMRASLSATNMDRTSISSLTTDT